MYNSDWCTILLYSLEIYVLIALFNVCLAAFVISKLHIGVFYVCLFVSFVYRIMLTCVQLFMYPICVCVRVCVCVCVCVYLHSGGHEHVVVPGYGSYAAVSAAFPAGCHPEEENRADLGKHPACSGSTHLAAVS